VDEEKGVCGATAYQQCVGEATTALNIPPRRQRSSTDSLNAQLHSAFLPLVTVELVQWCAGDAAAALCVPAGADAGEYVATAAPVGLV
jgi:hypothetical protein